MSRTLRSMNGIFAVDKPSGVSSSKVVLQLQSIFDTSEVFAEELAAMKHKVHEQLTAGTKWSASKIANRVRKTKIKVGHGGTLDPMASGVLVIGVGTGTKQLSHYLGECTKTYETRAVLGQATTTGDAEGEVVAQTAAAGVTLQQLRAAAAKFVGTLQQTPPVYSALKVDGKPMYEYAREGIPVPRAIAPRTVRVHRLEVHDDFGPHAAYGALAVSAAGDSVSRLVFNNPTLNDHPLSFAAEYVSDPARTAAETCTDVRPVLLDPAAAPPAPLPVFHATASVGSGTYIRSLVSDLGRAVGSSAFMAELVRSQQGDWVLGRNVFSVADFTDRPPAVWGAALRRVFADGAAVDLAAVLAQAEADAATVPAENETSNLPAETGPVPAETETSDAPAETKTSDPSAETESDAGADSKRRKVE